MVRAPMGFETRQERSEQGAGNEEGKIMSRSTTHSFVSSLPPSTPCFFSFFFFSYHPLQKPEREGERGGERKKMYEEEGFKFGDERLPYDKLSC